MMESPSPLCDFYKHVYSQLPVPTRYFANSKAGCSRPLLKGAGRRTGACAGAGSERIDSNLFNHRLGECLTHSVRFLRGPGVDKFEGDSEVERVTLREHRFEQRH